MKLKIKKGDLVEVIAGSEKGKKAKILEVQRKLLKVRLEGIKMQTHFDKKEGIRKKEGWLDYSNIRLNSPAGQKT